MPNYETSLNVRSIVDHYISSPEIIPPTSYNTLTIDLNAIRKNLSLIQQKSPQHPRMMPMVKASGYGTNAFILSSYLNKCGIDIVGVSQVNEAVKLRNEGYSGSIFCIFVAPFEAEYVARYDLEVGVSDVQTCINLSQAGAKSGKKILVHLDVDTGMNRFGCDPHDAPEIASAIQKLPGISLEGLMTHFVGAEYSTFDSFSKQQIGKFCTVIETLKELDIHPKWIHAENSGASLRFSLPFCNMIRLGLSTFGISPLENSNSELCPALTLVSRIVVINICKKNESVGYLQGYHVTREREHIAILPIGYHDGIHLHFSGKGYVLIHGKKAPYVGRICMDFMMVDVTEIPEARVGDSALIFGKELPLEEVARWSNSNVRELLTALGPRVERNFI